MRGPIVLTWRTTSMPVTACATKLQIFHKNSRNCFDYGELAGFEALFHIQRELLVTVGQRVEDSHMSVVFRIS